MARSQTLSLLAGVFAFTGAFGVVGTTAPQSAGAAADPGKPFFRLESSVSVGNKGEEILDVSVDAACDQPAWVFDHAELVVPRNRFGDVQFTSLPRSGCAACDPLTLRWYHEPTGYLTFEVHVYRRLENAPCPNDRN